MLMCCQNCKWYKPYEGTPDFDTDVEGECRRYPPQVYGTDDTRAYSSFPGVNLEEYCGEWTEQLWKESNNG